jgi:hypothetical protein
MPPLSNGAAFFPFWIIWHQFAHGFYAFRVIELGHTSQTVSAAIEGVRLAWLIELNAANVAGGHDFAVPHPSLCQSKPIASIASI